MFRNDRRNIEALNNRPWAHKKVVNRLLQHHNKSVYYSLAVRHVAEQIDKLYWAAGAPDANVTNDGSADDGIPPEDADLTTDETIAKLPNEWAADEADVSDYAAQLAHLRDLATKREAAKRKLQQYCALQQLLDPFRDPQKVVQPNLVTREGELADELARMRALSARVAGRICDAALDRAQLRGTGGQTDEQRDDEERELDANEKLRRVLAGAWHG
ncbi:kinetochore complex Fta4 of Sim4 subunit, or CENP-50-domain-containing protein [Cryomyces antarcticus]